MGYGDMAMKCSGCGAENPEGQKFCGICGNKMPEPPPVQPVQPAPIPAKQNWFSSNWKALTAIVIVVIVVLATVGLIYTQPWSKIKILARNSSGQPASYSFLIDGVEKARGTIYSGDFVIIGVWSVKTGTHTVKADCHYLGQLGPSLDGIYDYNFDYAVGPLFTKNAWIQLTPDVPDLIGDLTLYYDSSYDEVSVEGTVFNYASAPCYGALSITVWDSRGWSMTDEIPLGRVNGNGGTVEVAKTYDWPDFYLSQTNYNKVPTWTYSLTFS